MERNRAFVNGMKGALGAVGYTEFRDRSKRFRCGEVGAAEYAGLVLETFARFDDRDLRNRMLQELCGLLPSAQQQEELSTAIQAADSVLNVAQAAEDQALAASLGGGGEDQSWACAVCTFQNPRALSACSICETPAPDDGPPRPLPAATATAGASSLSVLSDAMRSAAPLSLAPSHTTRAPLTGGGGHAVARPSSSMSISRAPAPPSAAQQGAGPARARGASDCPAVMVALLVRFHHLLAGNKREDIAEWALELQLGGFSRTGTPGLLVYEGRPADVKEAVRRLRTCKWQTMELAAQRTLTAAAVPSGAGGAAGGAAGAGALDAMREFPPPGHFREVSTLGEVRELLDGQRAKAKAKAADGGGGGSGAGQRPALAEGRGRDRDPRSAGEGRVEGPPPPPPPPPPPCALDVLFREMEQPWRAPVRARALRKGKAAAASAASAASAAASSASSQARGAAHGFGAVYYDGEGRLAVEGVEAGLLRGVIYCERRAAEDWKKSTMKDALESTQAAQAADY
jgi:hypothetical protein